MIVDLSMAKKGRGGDFNPLAHTSEDFLKETLLTAFRNTVDLLDSQIVLDPTVEDNPEILEEVETLKQNEKTRDWFYKAVLPEGFIPERDKYILPKGHIPKK
jgi:hypothetical protein